MPSQGPPICSRAARTRLRASATATAADEREAEASAPSQAPAELSVAVSYLYDVTDLCVLRIDGTLSGESSTAVRVEICEELVVPKPGCQHLQSPCVGTGCALLLQEAGCTTIFSYIAAVPPSRCWLLLMRRAHAAGARAQAAAQLAARLNVIVRRAEALEAVLLWFDKHHPGLLHPFVLLKVWASYVYMPAGSHRWELGLS